MCITDGKLVETLLMWVHYWSETSLIKWEGVRAPQPGPEQVATIFLFDRLRAARAGCSAYVANQGTATLNFRLEALKYLVEHHGAFLEEEYLDFSIQNFATWKSTILNVEEELPMFKCVFLHKKITSRHILVGLPLMKYFTFTASLSASENGILFPIKNFRDFFPKSIC